jgi:hypothetical protein
MFISLGSSYLTTCFAFPIYSLSLHKPIGLGCLKAFWSDVQTDLSVRRFVVCLDFGETVKVCLVPHMSGRIKTAFIALSEQLIDRYEQSAYPAPFNSAVCFFDQHNVDVCVS